VDVWRKAVNRRHFTGGSDARIIMGRGEGEPDDDLSGNLQLGIATEDLVRRRYEGIAGGVPLGWYIVTVCYATTVISLGWYPWNFLLVGLPFLIKNKQVHERASVWCSSRARMIIGLADRCVVHCALNSMKATFALSGSRR